MKIGELVERSGLSAHTLRYYERIGLLPKISKDVSGQRNYQPSVLVWLAFVAKLRDTGMSVRDMVRYAELRNLGNSTAYERRQLLIAHRQQVQQKIDQLQTHLLALDDKIAFYAANYPDNEEYTDDRVKK
jgi:DNA-binding transcriptional MerR regulator